MAVCTEIIYLPAEEYDQMYGQEQAGKDKENSEEEGEDVEEGKEIEYSTRTIMLTDSPYGEGGDFGFLSIGLTI